MTTYPPSKFTKNRAILLISILFLASIIVLQAYPQENNIPETSEPNTSAPKASEPNTSELETSFQNTSATGLQAWQKPLKPGAWYQIKAGHFVIWYEEQDEAVAEELASYADKFYNQYKKLFRYNLKQVKIMVQGQYRVPNGSYSFVPPIINFYPTSAMLDSKGYNWNYYLLTHEFVHYMHLQYDKGLGAVLASIFGPVGRVVVMGTPVWQIEGLATAIESDYTSSGRMQNPIVNMPLRADILLQNKKKYLDMTLIYLDNEVPNAKRYSYGMELITYIRKEYGYQTAIDIWKHFMKFPLNFSARHKRFTGKTLYQLYDEMLAAKEAELEKYKTWQRGEELASKDNARAAYSITSTSDTAALVLKKGYDVQTQYMLYKPADNSVQKLFSVYNTGVGFATNTSAGAISKDGRYVVYQTSESDINRQQVDNLSAGRFNNLFLYDTQTEEHRRLTTYQSIVSPIISADHKYIYASEYTHSGNYTRIIRFSVDAPTEGFEVVYEGQESVTPFLAISPDGTKLAFVERSHLSGIRLQILNLTTNTVRTLVQEDYWLWMHNLAFVDNETINVNADIEETGVNIQLYSVSLKDNSWTRIARDKVGFASAMMIQGKVIYSSHNSTANSLYVYDEHTLAKEQAPETIDLASIERPVYNPNALNKYLNKRTIKNPDIAMTATEVLATEIASKRRIYGFIPSRLIFITPFYQWSQKSGTNQVGLISMWQGKTKMSSLAATVAYEIETLQPLYNMSYSFVVNPVGIIALSGLRDSSYDALVETSLLTDQYRGQYTRALYAGASPFAMVLALSGLWNSKTYNDSTETIKAALHREDLDATSKKIQFQAGLPLLWSTGNPTLISKEFSWQINPSVYYTPALLDIDTHNFQENIDAYIRAPLGRLLGIQLSSYSAFTNNTDHIGNLNVERFARYAPSDGTGVENLQGVVQPLFGSTTEMYQGTGSIETAIQSSYALDFMINFGNHQKGAYIFHPYTSYINFFAEQTVGYDTVQNELKMNEYLVVGSETGLTIAFFAAPVNFQLGTVVKIPYASYVEYDYMVYFSIGPQFYNVPGHSESTQGIE